MSVNCHIFVFIIMVMKQLERLNLVYSFLKSHQSSLKSINDFLSLQKAQVSRRQLERDIKDIRCFLLSKEEKLSVVKIKRTNYYSVLNDNIDFFEFKNIKHTNFYEANTNDKIYTLLKELSIAIDKQRQISIKKIDYDFTVDNSGLVTKKIDFAPIKIMKHRGSFYLCGFKVSDFENIVIYDINQVSKIVIKEKSFEYYKLLITVQKQLSKRFGVSKNIDDKVYKVELEFTNIVGAFIKRFHWHSTQKFQQETSNSNLIMTMNCGINRELIGWLFQWMYNVKVLNPPILKEYYNLALHKTQNINLAGMPFVYINLFEPKN